MKLALFRKTEEKKITPKLLRVQNNTPTAIETSKN